MSSYADVARLETHLMVEFLAEPDIRPNWKDAVWVRNAPRGPSPTGITALRKVQEKYGSVNVTTGNARPPSSLEVGIYVREDVMEPSPNPLRTYLSEP